MTWTAQITTVNRVQSGIAVDVLLVHDADKPFTQSFQTDGTMANLRNQVRNYITARDSAGTKSELTVSQSIDLTPDPAPQPPTAAQIAQGVFVNDWLLLQGYQRGVSGGVMDQASKTVTDLQSRVIAEFLPEYASLL